MTDKVGTAPHTFTHIVNQPTSRAQSTHRTSLFCSGEAHKSIVARYRRFADGYQFMSGPRLTSLLGTLHKEIYSAQPLERAS